MRASRPLLRLHWWWGLLVGLLLPILLVPTGLYLMRTLGHWETIASFEGGLWLASGLAGALLVFRRIWIGLLVAVAYVPVLVFLLQFLQVGAGCAVLGPYACP